MKADSRLSQMITEGGRFFGHLSRAWDEGTREAEAVLASKQERKPLPPEEKDDGPIELAEFSSADMMLNQEEMYSQKIQGINAHEVISKKDFMLKSKSQFTGNLMKIDRYMSPE